MRTWPPVFVTHSVDKHREAERILRQRIERRALDLPEIQDVEVDAVSLWKARAAHAALLSPVMVEDTGLFLEALSGLPGALIRWFEERLGLAGICAILSPSASRKAVAKTVVVIYDGEGDPLVFVGAVEGRIATEPVGENGFGWDRIFIPDGENRTLAQMRPEEKDDYSMRRQAFERMAEYRLKEHG